MVPARSGEKTESEPALLSVQMSFAESCCVFFLLARSESDGRLGLGSAGEARVPH